LGSKKARTIVIWISIVITLIGFGYFGYMNVMRGPIPLWDKVTMTYGGVFCIFLLFDEIGRQAAKNRKDSDARNHRPRPRAGGEQGQQIPAAQTILTAGQVRLERVRESQMEAFLQLVDDAATEVLALQELRPEFNATGHVMGTGSQEWFDHAHYYPFFIMYHDTCIGCCVLHTVHPAYEIVMFYVQSAMRRRHGGSVALDKLMEFAQLVGNHTVVSCELTAENMRGQRFFQANGFHLVSDAELPRGRVEYARPMR
jgi:RimJ/RimL family protein N-acetyltransferase